MKITTIRSGIVALPADMPVWVDAAVLSRPSIILGGGSRSMKIRVAPEVLRRLPNVEVIEGLAAPPSPD